MADCSSLLNTAITASDCSKSAVAGTESLVYLMNHSDIDRTLSTKANDVITQLTLKTGKYATPYTSYQDSTVGESSVKVGTYRNTSVHNLKLHIFVKTEAIKTFVNDIMNSRVVAVVENRENGNAGDVKFECYGFNGGLKVVNIQQSTAVADGIYYAIELATPDTSTEPTLPNSVYKTSLATTIAMLEALIEPEA